MAKKDHRNIKHVQSSARGQGTVVYMQLSWKSEKVWNSGKKGTSVFMLPLRITRGNRPCTDKLSEANHRATVSLQPLPKTPRRCSGVSTCSRIFNLLCMVTTLPRLMGGSRKCISEGFMVQLSVLERSPLSGKSDPGELEHFIFCFISNEPRFLPSSLLCFVLEQKAGLFQVHQ